MKKYFILVLVLVTSNLLSEEIYNKLDLHHLCFAGVSFGRGVKEYNRCNQIQNEDLKNICMATLEGTPSYCMYMNKDDYMVDEQHLCAAGVAKSRQINEHNRCLSIRDKDLKKVCFAIIQSSASFCDF